MGSRKTLHDAYEEDSEYLVCLLACRTQGVDGIAAQYNQVGFQDGLCDETD